MFNIKTIFYQKYIVLLYYLRYNNYRLIYLRERSKFKKGNNMKSTNLLNLLHASSIKIRYDTEVKKILSNKTILSWILKFTVTEFKSYSIQEIRECIEGEPQISEVPVRPGHESECIMG